MADPKKPGLGDDALKAAASAPFKAVTGAVVSTIKSGVQKINPFDKKINTTDVSDTGVESLRLGYTTAKQGKNTIKTAQQTIKTTQRTIKTTGRAAKETGKTVVKVTKVTARVTATVVKAVAHGVAYVVSVIPTPILLILLAVIIFLIFMIGAVMSFMGGAVAGASSVRQAYENALGLDDPVADYPEGAGYYAIAMQNAQNAFNAQIDALYYDASDLPNSDLVYFERNSDGNPKAKLDHSELATDAVKTQIKNTWLPCLTEEEVMAIAYVYMQKQENDAHGTTGALYKVEYTQDVLDTVVNALWVVSERVYSNQQCPDKNCDTHEVTNPTWTYFKQKQGEAADIINGITPGDEEQARKDYVNYSLSLAATPEKIDEAYCPKNHDKHSIALTFYAKTSVLMQLNIAADPYSTWVEMTTTAFENIENTTEAPTNP